MTLVLHLLGWLIAVLAGVGTLYTCMTALFLRRFFIGIVEPGPLAGPLATVTALKPLHGAESGLAENLASVFEQRLANPLQVIFGIQDPADPARAVAEAVIAQHPSASAVVSFGDGPGSNRKVGNLIQMSAGMTGDIFVLSDSDIAMPPEHLRRVLASLDEPGVGVVTCPYYGVGRSGFWSEVAAMGLSYQFMPNLVTGVSLGLAHPCMGSTIALRRETLARIGGFEAFQDVLADDYAIGAAVRRLGLKSEVAPYLVAHTCTETSLSEVVSHELRWARTVLGVDPGGYAGSLVTHPVPLALVAVLLFNGAWASLAILAAALIARQGLKTAADSAISVNLSPWWLLPMRDILSFAVFVGSFFGHTVVWRGKTLRVATDGRLTRV